MNNAQPHNDRKEVTLPQLTVPFVLLLLAFLTLTVISYSATLVHNREAEKADKLINVVSQQRMLIHEYISKINYMLVGLATDNLDIALKKKRDLDNVAQRFEDRHHTLIYGGTLDETTDTHSSLVRIPPLDDDRARYLLQEAYRDWSELKRTSLLSLRSNTFDITSSPYFSRLLDQANITVEKINTVMEYIINKNRAELKRLDRLLATTITAGVLVLMFTGHYVFRRFIKPLNQSFRQLTAVTVDLARERDRAEQSSQAKSRFLSHMSHELRTPLNAILGYSQLLDVDIKAGNPIDPSHVTEMLGAGHHLLTLIDEVLDLQKIEAGKVDVLAQPIRIGDKLQECLPLVAHQAEGRGITITDRVSRQDYIVRADPQRIKQVLLNLLSNAVKYNIDGGRIDIDVDTGSEHRLRLTITNSGAGLSKDDIQRLFQPFERLHNGRAIDGTGIGLVICKHLVELMGGRIGVDSIPDVSTSFWFELEQLDAA